MQLIEKGYDLKKGFTPLITNDKTDKVELSLRELGARGIKISGAGGGGHIFCFFPEGIPQNLESHLPAHTKKVNCEYTEMGLKFEKVS
jgi:galactokinase/mevalonate kinase-like predicted kinase